MNDAPLEHLIDSDSGETYFSILRDKDKSVARIYEIAEMWAEDIDPWVLYPKKGLQPIDGGSANVFFHTEDAIVLILTMRDAGLMRDHVHSDAHMMVGVLEGMVRLRKSNGAWVLRPGDWKQVKAGQLHAMSWTSGSGFLCSFQRFGWPL